MCPPDPETATKRASTTVSAAAAKLNQALPSTVASGGHSDEATDSDRATPEPDESTAADRIVPDKEIAPLPAAYNETDGAFSDSGDEMKQRIRLDIKDLANRVQTTEGQITRLRYSLLGIDTRINELEPAGANLKMHVRDIEKDSEAAQSAVTTRCLTCGQAAPTSKALFEPGMISSMSARNRSSSPSAERSGGQRPGGTTVGEPQRLTCCDALIAQAEVSPPVRRLIDQYESPSSQPAGTGLAAARHGFTGVGGPKRPVSANLSSGSSRRPFSARADLPQFRRR
eukprot:gnl/TRDRNA2_/TRDRNA2_147505_c2_seq1.p1 gnl/TRDRNA2_/TRDRNA2_147505_c2~~gnl/TRDRNA2_/TRDRNA2_147505_c2_seq1.p1  ORF type:complete len:322 (-),score=46.45 gnl/TRDRNA2_/TRDRNA2_147505_c2_seq1:168-1022(-)